MNQFDLSGKVVWVTGGSRGLGRAIVGALVRAGAMVAVTARNERNLKQLVDGYGTDHVDIHPGSVDDTETVDEVVAKIVRTHGRLDGLVNCAGISPAYTRAENVDDATWNKIISVNLTGTFICCRSAGRVMQEQGHGSIVNVTSVHATAGAERIVAYAASKGGTHALTRSLAVEWAKDGIRVNALAPGYFYTDLSAGLLDSRHGERIRNSIPMRRTGVPHEVGGAAVYLISDASSYVTGATLYVDGGWQAW